MKSSISLAIYTAILAIVLRLDAIYNIQLGNGDPVFLDLIARLLTLCSIAGFLYWLYRDNRP